MKKEILHTLRYPLLLAAAVLLALLLWTARKPARPVEQAELKPREKTYLRREGTFRPGETLEKVLLRDIYDRVLADELIQGFARVFDVRKIRGDRRYTILTDSASVRFEYYRTPSRPRACDSTVLQPELVRCYPAHPGPQVRSPPPCRRGWRWGERRTDRASATVSVDIDFFCRSAIGDEFRWS